eukprot:Opistho-2@50534
MHSISSCAYSAHSQLVCTRKGSFNRASHTLRAADASLNRRASVRAQYRCTRANGSTAVPKCCSKWPTARENMRRRVVPRSARCSAGSAQSICRLWKSSTASHRSRYSCPAAKGVPSARSNASSTSSHGLPIFSLQRSRAIQNMDAQGQLRTARSHSPVTAGADLTVDSMYVTYASQSDRSKGWSFTARSNTICTREGSPFSFSKAMYARKASRGGGDATDTASSKGRRSSTLATVAVTRFVNSGVTSGRPIALLHVSYDAIVSSILMRGTESWRRYSASSDDTSFALSDSSAARCSSASSKARYALHK